MAKDNGILREDKKNLLVIFVNNYFTTLLFFAKYLMSIFKQVFFFLLRKIIDPARIRTWNPLIRSQMPYPLGHGATHSTVILFASYATSNLNAFMAKRQKNLLALFFLRAAVLS